MKETERKRVEFKRFDIGDPIQIDPIADKTVAELEEQTKRWFADIEHLISENLSATVHYRIQNVTYDRQPIYQLVLYRLENDYEYNKRLKTIRDREVAAAKRAATKKAKAKERKKKAEEAERALYKELKAKYEPL